MKQVTHIRDANRVPYTNKGEEVIPVWSVITAHTRVVVALADIAPDDNENVATVGEFSMPAVTGTAFEFGEQLYWDDTNNVLTKDAAEGANVPAGWCTEDKPSAQAWAKVKIG